MPSRPTGPPIASGPSSQPAPKAGRGNTRSRRRARRGPSGRRLFAFDRALDVSLVAGADEAGRGCLAGPLVAAAVLFDYQTLGVRETRALAALNDSKQHSAEGREELYPLVLRSAARVTVVSRCSASPPGSRTRSPASSTASPCPASVARSARSSTATPPAPRSPPRRS